jgi:hypothetical protein
MALSVCVLPVGADASSTLLSGYGGPGEGNQAIIGSTLIGGGGRGGGGGAGGESQIAAGSGSIETPAPAPKASGSGDSHTKGSSHAHKRSGASGGRTSGGGDASANAPATPTTHGDGGSTLGLTGGDLLYIVLALGVLALTALLTGRLTRRRGGPSEAQ